MKRINLLIVSCLFSLIAMAGNGDPVLNDANLFCAKLKDGIIVVMKEGTIITTEIMLDNGTRIEPDGSLIKKDGRIQMLKDGDCVDKDGKIIVLPANESEKK